MTIGGVRVSQELPRGPSRPVERPAWCDLDGVEVLPPCRWCNTPLVWRGTWYCVGCFARHGLHPDYVLTDIPHALPAEALAGVPLGFRSGCAPQAAPFFSSGEGHNSTEGRVSPLQWAPGRRGDWSDGVEALTSYGRRAQAARLLVRGARAAVDGPKLSAWHEARVRSLGERWQRHAACGALALVAQNGGRIVPVENRCGDWRMCHRCRDRRRFVLQRDGDQVARAARQLYARECGRYYRGREGRWGERMVTLTIPHSGSVAEDARLYRAAWPRFLRRLHRHLVNDRGVVPLKREGKRSGSVPWRRAVEVASTKEAHFHAHIWMFCPFIDQVLLHVWWGQSLLESGMPAERMPRRRLDELAGDERVPEWLGHPEEVPWPVVDVRGGSRSKYVGKVGMRDYIVKSDGVRESLHPVHAANAYEALSGLRVVQWASGWAPGRGESAGWHVRRATDAEREEWCAKFARNCGVASDRNVSSEAAPAAAPLEQPETPWRARDGPKTATAPGPLEAVRKLSQLSLEWGRPGI